MNTVPISNKRALLGGFKFVSRTFEGHFRDNPFVLDADANLYIGPADYVPRDEHATVEVLYHFLRETGRVDQTVSELLRDRRALLDAFTAFDEARRPAESGEFQILIFCTYDGELLDSPHDDDLPAGPCGRTVNEIKRRLYQVAMRADVSFASRELTPAQVAQESQFTGEVGLELGDCFLGTMAGTLQAPDVS
ncbi:MAG: hypothetical protein AAF493_26310 [Pseudomonadota bacterium]